MKPVEPNAVPLASDESPPTPWQYSLKSLLVLTTIVSVCLAIGVHFVGVIVVIVVVGLIQVSIVSFADWLIRPGNRRVLAFVTAGSWMAMGSGSLIISIGLVLNAMEALVSFNVTTTDTSFASSWFSAGILAIFGGLCFIVAGLRWRKLAAGANYQGLSDSLLKKVTKRAQ